MKFRKITVNDKEYKWGCDGYKVVVKAPKFKEIITVYDLLGIEEPEDIYDDAIQHGMCNPSVTPRDIADFIKEKERK